MIVYGFPGAVNVFHGQIDGARLRVGETCLLHDAAPAPHGAEAIVCARPHEREIPCDPTMPGFTAVVARPDLRRHRPSDAGRLPGRAQPRGSHPRRGGTKVTAIANALIDGPAWP